MGPSFFFQAEDGIRGLYVTGVQTCALPIYLRFLNPRSGGNCCCRGFGVHREVSDDGYRREIGRASCRESEEIGEGSGYFREMVVRYQAPRSTVLRRTRNNGLHTLALEAAPG